ncbi:GDP-mannose-dependent alpha-(1-2)-phosphatidylinositol mannosyltransferase [compost metagenome]
MHIAIDARIISSTTGTYVERLISHLERIDTTNRYTILVRPNDIDFWQPINPNFSVMAADIPDYSFAEQTTFKRLLDELKPDLVHFCMPQQPIFYRGAHITTIHDLTLFNTYNSDKHWLIFHLKQLVGRVVFKRVGKTSRHIITPTNYTKQEYTKFARISADKVTVTYEAADGIPGALEPYEHPFTQYLLYVGQQSDYKNLVRLAEAHQKLLVEYPDLGLILVGKLNDSAKKNKQLFEKRGYKNILFTDFLPDSKRNWLYVHCAAYIFPSLMEGFGLPGLEAMNYGAPVISSNATCLPEVYGKAAHYFDPLDTSDMAESIAEVLSDDTLRQDLITRGHEQVRSYSWQRMAEQTLAIYMDASQK